MVIYTVYPLPSSQYSPDTWRMICEHAQKHPCPRNSCVPFLPEFQCTPSSIEFIQLQWFCALAFMSAALFCLYRSKVPLRYFPHLKKEHLNMGWVTWDGDPFSLLCLHCCTDRNTGFIFLASMYKSSVEKSSGHLEYLLVSQHSVNGRGWVFPVLELLFGCTVPRFPQRRCSLQPPSSPQRRYPSGWETGRSPRIAGWSLESRH